MCHNGAFVVWFLHSKKGGKIQTGLNCEDDSLSKACLWLAYSSFPLSANFITGFLGSNFMVPGHILGVHIRH